MTFAKSQAAKEREPLRGSSDAKSGAAKAPENPHANRETVESIVVAVILAFLFRGFVAEAFVIPTGSMAPSLQGNHKDLACEKCGYRYRASASMENDDQEHRSEVTDVMCPICHYPTHIDPKNFDHATYSGDRIVVSKFSYLLSDPKRWDVIVFKFPGNAKQNYIKRLVGLPNETIRIRHGDLHIQKAEESEFRIARKPEYRQKAMLQLVDDTHHLAPDLMQAGFPPRWRPASPEQSGWSIDEDGKRFTLQSPGPEVDWLRYRHVIPTIDDWQDVANGRRLSPRPHHDGELITDLYAYNTSNAVMTKNRGWNWVGDLAVEAEVELLGEQGELVLELIEGGRHFTCRIQAADGTATLTIDQGDLPFTDEQGQTATSVTGQTRVRGNGSYHLRFSNVDDELRLWVDERLVTFEGPTTYNPGPEVAPRWSPSDPGDLEPVRIGSRQAAVRIERLRVLRDIYYVAASYNSNYSDFAHFPSYSGARMPEPIRDVLSNPASWETTRLFAERRTLEFKLEEDQFFPCGDNSPESKDARIWSDNGEIPNYVTRDQLTGEALMIYCPHFWYSPLRIPLGPGKAIAITPNFGRMGLIR